MNTAEIREYLVAFYKLGIKPDFNDLQKIVLALCDIIDAQSEEITIIKAKAH